MQHKDQTLNGQVYWRSDTRAPSVILRDEGGFDVRMPTSEQEWLKKSIHENPNIISPDLYCDFTVCMSTSAYAAALFPISRITNHTSYLYAIALPPAQQINTSNTLIRRNDNPSPSNHNRLVLDFHSYQVARTAEALERNSDQYPGNPDLASAAGWSLYAYEAMTKWVPVENIIAVAKITRGQPQNRVTQYTYNNNFQTLQTISYDFKIVGDVIINSKFKDIENLQVLDTKGPTTIKVDYKKNKIQALKFFSAAKNQVLQTTRTSDGLGGKTFAVPSAKCFFFEETNNKPNPNVNEYINTTTKKTKDEENNKSEMDDDYTSLIIKYNHEVS